MVPYYLLSLGLVSHVLANDQLRPTASLSSGIVIGTTTTLPSATAAVNKYLGVPFAAPPERFSPPTDPIPWTEPLDASAFPPACVQQYIYPELTRNRTMELFGDPGRAPPPGSEDCLYLNVYAPSEPAPEEGRAVMVWLFGGGLMFGTGSLELYDGSSFATNQGVIIVTMNYRTNVLGFPNSPEIPFDERNVGFLDQRKALDWVQKNIASFGGDPAKVTIFGESAGGYSVKQLVAAPPNPLPFHAAIMESQATASGDGNASYNTLLELTACANATSPLACLRGTPVETITDVIERNSLIFPPVSDGVTNFRDVTDAFASGTAAQVPILIGTNADEGTWVPYTGGINDTNTDVREFLNETYPGDYALHDAILAAYPPDVVIDPFLFVAAYSREIQFHCPAARFANLTVDAGFDVWRYYFQGIFPNYQFHPDAGAWHFSEISIVFGTFEREGATDAQYELSRYMQKAWADFAKDPAAGPGWPMLEQASGETVAALGRDGSGGLSMIDANTIDSICAAYGSAVSDLPLK